jgi:hypothetical protein
MAYTLYNSDGSILTILADSTVDQSTTSLALVGKNTNSYGQYFNENFIKLLSNGASSEPNRTLNPITGQFWYNNVTGQLQIFDNELGWRNAIGATINPNLPSELAVGDLWFDQNNKQLNIKINASSSTWVIGPAFSSQIGDNGWVLPITDIIDPVGNAQQVTLLKNYGTTIGAISSIEFTASSGDSLNYFNTTTATIANGLTIDGDIYYTGKLLNKYLSLNVELQALYFQYYHNSSSFYTYDYSALAYTNVAIASYLSLMYPPVNSNSYDLYYEPGLPLGSEARVLVHTGAGGGGGLSFDDYHVRRFSIVYDSGSQQNRWEPVIVYPIPQTRDGNGNITSYYQTLSNVVPDPDPSQVTALPWTHVPA